MRLGSCIAVELLVGATTLTALGVGSAWGVGELRSYFDPDDQVAATPDPVRLPDPAPPPAPAIVAARAAVEPARAVGLATPEVALSAVEPPLDPVGTPSWHARGQDDAGALAPLLAGKVVKVKFNRGGSSLSLRLDFDNGARAAFKPEQIHPQSNPRREIAAFRIDRLLGINRVPPAVGRSFTVAEIEAAVPSSERSKIGRLDKEAVDRKGVLRGELSWWIPVIENGKVGGFFIDDTDGIVTWRRMLRPGAKIPAKDLALVRQLSNLITFDFLIDNPDRWSGSNAKVSEDGKVLYFMDNTMAFSTNGKAHRKSHTYLSRVQTFSRSLIGAIRGLTEEQILAAVADDIAPFPRLLTAKEIAALLSRRDKLMAYVDALIAEHGEDKVLAFP